MFSWCSFATDCASRSRRAFDSGSAARCLWRILIATSRLSVSSSARYTTAIPPWPTSWRSLYRSGILACSIVDDRDDRVIGVRLRASYYAALRLTHKPPPRATDVTLTCRDLPGFFGPEP